MQPKDTRRTESQWSNAVGGLGQCLIDGDTDTKSRDRRMRSKALGISFIIEIAGLVLLIVAPLMTGVAQPHYKSTSFVPIGYTGPQTHSLDRHPQTTLRRANPSRTSIVIFAMGPATPTPTLHSEVEDPPSLGVGPIGISSLLEGLSISGVRSTIIPAQPPNETRKPEEKRAVKISEPVLQAQLISRPEPHYPPLARQAGTEGTVRLHAIISRDGRIAALEVLSGPPLLVQAAVEAVREWHYRPTILNGEPVEVETSITVVFRLNR